MGYIHTQSGFHSLNLSVCYLYMTELMTTNIEDKIITIRGQQVMLDRDLAELYQVETKVLNQAVKRNIEKFDSFMFRVTKEEKSELVTNCDRFKRLKHSSVNPMVFTEHGVLMLASVLNSQIAIQVNRKIIEVFVSLRQKIIQNPKYDELKHGMYQLERQLINVEDKLTLQQKMDTTRQDKKIEQLSGDVGEIKQILNAFQDSHIIIKRPEDEGQG